MAEKILSGRYFVAFYKTSVWTLYDSDNRPYNAALAYYSDMAAMEGSNVAGFYIEGQKMRVVYSDAQLRQMDWWITPCGPSRLKVGEGILHEYMGSIYSTGKSLDVIPDTKAGEEPTTTGSARTPVTDLDAFYETAMAEYGVNSDRTLITAIHSTNMIIETLLSKIENVIEGNTSFRTRTL